MVEIEIWKDVVGYENIYEVSNLGRVKMLKRIVNAGNGSVLNLKESIKSLHLVGRGYKAVNLCKDGNKKPNYIHRLVAQAFIPNPHNKKTVNHIDGDKLNNKVDNLEWMTYSENNKHAYDNKLKIHPFTGIATCKNPNSKPIIKLDLGYNVICEYDSITTAAKESNIPLSTISCYLNGYVLNPRKFRWRYK